MLGFGPLGSLPISDVASNGALPFVQAPDALRSAPQANYQLGVSTPVNLLLTTLAAVTAAAVVRTPLAFSPQQKTAVAAHQYVNTLVLGISAGAVQLPFVQRSESAAPVPNRQVFVDVAPRLIGKTLPDLGTVGKQQSESAPTVRRIAPPDGVPNLLVTTLVPAVQAIPVGRQAFDSLAAIRQTAGSDPVANLLLTTLGSQVQALPIGQSNSVNVPVVRSIGAADSVRAPIGTLLPGPLPIGQAAGDSTQTIRQPVQSIDAPNLLGTTLAVAVQAAPVGQVLFDSAPYPKYEVVAEFRASQLTLGMPDPAPVVVPPVVNEERGGFWPEFERYQTRRMRRIRELEELEREALEAARTDPVTAEVAALLHQQQKAAAELEELHRLEELVRTARVDETFSDAVADALRAAQRRATTAALDRLQRLARDQIEEEEFLLQAALLVLH